MRVYDRILRQAKEPVILHWLGEMFDPALAGYWGSADHMAAMDTCLEIIETHAAKVDGVKISLLSKEKEIAMRRRVARASAFMNTRDRRGSPVVHTAEDPGIDPRDWAFVGTPDDCIEQIGRWRERLGYDYIGLALANWPKEQTARKEQLHYVSEAVLKRLG